MKLGYRLLFVLKHLEIITKKIKNTSFLVSLYRKYQIQDWHKKSHLKLILLINFHRAPRSTELWSLYCRHAFLKAVLDKFWHWSQPWMRVYSCDKDNLVGTKELPELSIYFCSYQRSQNIKECRKYCKVFLLSGFPLLPILLLCHLEKIILNSSREPES